MITIELKRLFHLFKKMFRKNPDKFLRKVSGVVHVGANSGQERFIYEAHGLNVIWVEPIPEIFTQLKANIKEFKSQIAFQALITDLDNKEYKFHIANNSGGSSSIFDMKQHRDIWPEVRYINSLLINSITLTTLFRKENVVASKYQALIMDTQGSELLVLRGSIPIIRNFKFIKTEVPDFESYKGCCQLSDINYFMKVNGFREFSRNKFASRKEVGNYFDIIYKRCK